MRKTVKTFLVVPAVCGLLAWGTPASAGFRIMASNDQGGNGAFINLIVREVKVTPIRAHVGDTVRVEMVIENRGDLVQDTATAEIRANGKVVASRPVFYGFGGEGERIQRLTLTWDTRGSKPGEYKIRGEFFVWNDASEFDNFLDAKEHLKLIPAGSAFPNGEEEGGTGIGRDPRYKPAAGVGEGNGVPSDRSGSY